MPGRRRGARTGRGWDAAPPRTRRAPDPPYAADDPGPDTSGSRSQPPRDPAELAREICLRQLSVRPRTRAELATALRRRGIDDEIAAEVLDRYSDVGMIDDVAFARAWVSTRHHGRGLARRALATELRQRGVEPDAVADALTEVDGETEVATARALVERKLRLASGGDPEALFRRLVGMLARKGYSAGLSIRVVKQALAEREDTAGFAEVVDPDVLADQIGGGD